jgi:hypothetical protein
MVPGIFIPYCLSTLWKGEVKFYFTISFRQIFPLYYKRVPYISVKVRFLTKLLLLGKMYHTIQTLLTRFVRDKKFVLSWLLLYALLRVKCTYRTIGMFSVVINTGCGLDPL